MKNWLQNKAWFIFNQTRLNKTRLNQPRKDTFKEKYVNIAKRFHYVEDKIRRRDAERLATEATILSSLEKLQENLVKVQKTSNSKSEIFSKLETKMDKTQVCFDEFKEIVSKYINIEYKSRRV